jgi:hypothetical protein
MTRKDGIEEISGGQWLWYRLRNSTRNPLWRDDAMAHTDGPHQKLSEHLRVVARGPGAERLLTRLRSAGLRIETGADLMAVLERRSESGEPDAALVECLARIAPRDELAALALLELLGRRLEAMASQLARRDDITREEAESNVLGAAWEVLARRRPSERAARLDAIWTEVRAASASDGWRWPVHSPRASTWQLPKIPTPSSAGPASSTVPGWPGC